MTRVLLAIIVFLAGVAFVFLGYSEFVGEAFRPHVIGGGIGLIGTALGTYIFSFHEERKEELHTDRGLDEKSVTIFDNFSSVNLMDVITKTRRRLLFFAVSGRNVLSSPQIVNEFRRLISNNRQIEVRFLGLNQYADNEASTNRRKMMNIPGRFNTYETDFTRGP